jgi:soluble lytic murein transglycosylase-like protein
MQRSVPPWRAARNVAGLAILSAALGACSMGGLDLSTIKPRPAVVASVQGTGAPAPVVTDADFTPLAYAEPRKGAATSVDRLISRYAALYGVPESLVRRVVARESGYNPGARNGQYYGLMQISHATARSMGYSGSPRGLLDAETNLKYAVKYLRGAWLVAGGSSDAAISNYSRGYYYDAKRRGMLEMVGLN